MRGTPDSPYAQGLDSFNNCITGNDYYYNSRYTNRTVISFGRTEQT